MKEMYVKPMIEKIIFDNADIITTSVDSLVISQSGSDSCTMGNNGKTFQNKNDGCIKIEGLTNKKNC